MLIEWYSLDTAREAVRTLLAPLDQMGRKKSEVAIRTLAAYLDNQGSLSRAAKALHLHRNSVAYRIERIFELLEIDPEDPDERLLLQLACRARSLG
jgi:DNA-binding PucR family transcriptional regulator